MMYLLQVSSGQILEQGIFDIHNMLFTDFRTPPKKATGIQYQWLLTIYFFFPSTKQWLGICCVKLTAMAMVKEARKQARRKLRPRSAFPIKRKQTARQKLIPGMSGNMLEARKTVAGHLRQWAKKREVNVTSRAGKRMAKTS